MIKQNKKYYNNLKDSIAITISLIVAIILLVLPISLAVSGNVIDGTNTKAVIIAFSLIFGSMCLVFLYWLIRYCYSYYIIFEDRIVYRNVYCKKTIMYCDIKKIEIKEEGALILGTYKTDILSIYNEESTIKIFINDKNRDDIVNFATKLKENIKQ